MSDGCGSPPRWPTSGPGRSCCCPGDGENAGVDSMRPSKCCIETGTGTERFSAPATVTETGE
jgi:hypothetical protein